jgi:hypothetical protein
MVGSLSRDSVDSEPRFPITESKIDAFYADPPRDAVASELHRQSMFCMGNSLWSWTRRRRSSRPETPRILIPAQHTAIADMAGRLAPL